MEASLVVCVLAALLATGAGLQCESCEAEGTDCTGNRQTCRPEQNSCGLILTEITLEREKTHHILKTCATSSQCGAGPVSTNFGKGMMRRTSITCCQTDGCTPAPAKVPPPDTKPNGRRCPACYALDGGQCREESVACTGIETQCVDLDGPQKSDGSGIRTVMKGCGTEYVCAQVNAGSGAFAGINGDVTTARCRPASSDAGTAPGPAGLLFPALAGLLLLKSLS